MGCAIVGSVVFLQCWTVVGGYEVLWWVQGALPPHIFTWWCCVNHPVLVGTEPVYINDLGTTPGPAPASGNLRASDVRPWS